MPACTGFVKFGQILILLLILCSFQQLSPSGKPIIGKTVTVNPLCKQSKKKKSKKNSKKKKCSKKRKCSKKKKYAKKKTKSKKKKKKKSKGRKRP